MMFRSSFRRRVWSLIFRARGAGGLGCKLAGLAALFLFANLLQAAPVAEDNSDLAQWRMTQVPQDATNGLGGWIWANHTSDKQTCQFWRSLEIPRDVKVSRALLKMTVDNGYRLFLDGRELGQGLEWRALTEYDITLLLSPGTHTLAVIAFNDFFQAGMRLGLRIELSNERVIQIVSDETWRIVPNDRTGWETKTEASADWPPAKILKSSELSPYWWTSAPLDYVVVPQFQPVIIPFWHRGWFHIALVSLLGIVFFVCIYLMTQLIVQNKEQRLLNLERSRIARDIHDDVGTRLTKLVLQGEVAQSTQPASSEVRQQLDMICEGLRGVLGAMDEVLWAVNPRHDTLENFIAYICDYAQTFLQNTKIQCLLEVESGIPPLNFDLPLRRSLLLVVKEALNNAAKHSEASRLLLKIHRSGQKLIVAVEDNGRGFDMNQITQDRSGLKNLFQRMNEAGGDCKIVTRPGGGCRVEFSISLTRHPARSWFSNRTQPPGQKAHIFDGTALPGGADETSKSIP
jgi:signal transduction histidine kinase